MIAGYHADKLRLEVEDDPEGLPNLIQNPSGLLGSWGWVTPVVGTAIGKSVWGTLQFNTAATQACHWTSEFMPITEGKFAAARFDTPGSKPGTSVKVRFEWYTSAKALVSSTAQSSTMSAAGPHWYFPGTAVPVGAAYVKIRFDLYRGAGNPSAGDWFAFERVMVTWANTLEDLGTTRTNIIPNPTFDVNVNGWGGTGGVLTRGTDVPQSGAGYAVRSETSPYRKNFSISNYNPPKNTFDITGGRDYTLSAYFRGTSGSKATLNMTYWAGATRTDFSSPTITVTTAWSRLSVTATAPPGATGVAVYLVTDTTASTAYAGFDSVLLEEGTTLNDFYAGTIGVTNFDFVDSSIYRNILGPTHNISIERDELNVGLMTAQIADAALDPARFGLIRPGRRVRLLANDQGSWVTVFTGKIGKNPTVYKKSKEGGDPTRSVQISLVAVDASSTLSNRAENRSVATIADLPEVLEGKGVPWSCNGSGAQVAGATIVALNDAASTQDQVALTRDSCLGYAWMDRSGVLQVWDADQMPDVTVNHFSDLVAVPGVLSYTDIDVDYDTERCINSVKVDFLRYQPVAGQTETVSYGPYQDQSSIDTYGAQEATFTIAGLTESPAVVQAYADKILTANATPQMRCNSLVMPVRDAAELHTAATADLYDRQRVVYDGRVDALHRTVTLSHQITAEKWITTFTFSGTGTVAPPTMIPAPPARVTGTTTGSQAVTTNSAGVATITHGLGRAPTYADAVGTSTSTRIAVTARTATTLTIHVVSASTGADYVGGVTVMWMVL